MARPTIRDVAEAAGVSVSTVNRVLGGAVGVREPTVRLVKETAERIGFYGVGAIRSQLDARRARYRFGFLLLQPSRNYYQMLGTALQSAATEARDAQVDAVIAFAEDLSPQYMVERITKLGESCDAVAVVSSVHPFVLGAVEALQQKGVPVFAMISPLGIGISYVGPDNWKAGRTAAWAIANICKSPGKVGILVGNHRFRCQEANESGFRSYFREFAPDFTILEPLSTFETSAVAEELTEKLLREHPDIKGLFVAGGGISGVIRALRAEGKAGQVVTVGHQLMDNTREALLDHTLTMLIHDPMETMARETIAAMIRAKEEGSSLSAYQRNLPFDLCTQENI
jgi:LacI family transcriptional regulator